jgi:hypothetical protein
MRRYYLYKNLQQVRERGWKEEPLAKDQVLRKERALPGGTARREGDEVMEVRGKRAGWRWTHSLFFRLWLLL